MSCTALDERTALVLIDLQRGILRMPVIHPVEGVLANARLLVEAFGAARLPVVFVRVNDIHRTRTDEGPPAMVPSADFDEFTEQLRPGRGDVIVTKHGWDAFCGTGLDLQLRRRGVTGIVLGGISASRGVESTARSAHARGYNLTFATGAISDVHEPSFDHSLRVIYPRIGEVDTTENILRVLAATAAKGS